MTTPPELRTYLEAALQQARGEAAVWALRKDVIKTTAAVAVSDALQKILNLVEPKI